jgi:dTDP-glucose 4,6-dehydratase
MKRKFKNILVTGGSGFIGTNFIHKILEKNSEIKIYNIDKLTYASNNENHKIIKENFTNYEFIHGDICNKDFIKDLVGDNSIDCIVHFAAESHVDRSIKQPEEFLKTNIIGTYNLLEAGLAQYDHNKNFVFLHVSTDEVYGSLDIDSKPFTETNQYLPNSPYSASKGASDMLVRAWHHTYNLPTLTTNCSNNYGPYQFPEKLIPLTIFNAINLLPITIYGNGKNIRDWLHVEDHCMGILRVLYEGKLGEVYNIGGNNEYTNIDIVNKICEILDELRPINNYTKDLKSYNELITYIKDRPGHDYRYAIDSSKLSKNLKWSPKISFEEGIKATVIWYLDNQNWVKSVLNK